MLAVLAAGQSSRFSDRDKLSALLGDRMLGLHAAGTAAELSFAQKLVVASPEHPCTPQWRALGYQVVANPDAATGQASSVRLAAAHALKTGASGLCILLADMPFVTRQHIDRLVAAFAQSGGTSTVASARNGQPMPPAIFASSALESLIALQGDTGARALLAEARLVAGDDPVLRDIDTAEDLAEANIIYSRIQ